MKITYDELKNAYKSYIRQQVPSSRQGCPSPDSILCAFDSSTSSTDKTDVINHVAGCSYCLREFELWLSFFREQEKALQDIIGWARAEEKGTLSQSKKAKSPEPSLDQGTQIRSLWKWAFGFIFAAAITGLIFVGVKSFS